MKDVNKIILVGRMGADPVLRDTKDGVAVAQFPLATSRWIKPDPEAAQKETNGEPVPGAERTQWHKVVVWGKQAETCSLFLKKGDAVYVEGEVRSHKYESKEGESRVAFEVHAETVSFLGKISGRKPSDEQDKMKSDAVAKSEALASGR